MRKFVVGGNWKMQVTTIEESVKIAKDIVKVTETIKDVEVFIAPSYNALYQVSQTIKGSNLKLAAQNVHHIEKGAFTGEISVNALKEANCEYVILGHSERRRIFNESDELINLKVLKALEFGFKPVLCIGETAKERGQDLVAEVNKTQLSGSLRNVSKELLEHVIIAYEPVWAINNKYLNPDTEIKPATPEEANEAHQIVREWFKEKYSDAVAHSMRIIYGGSMSGSNCEELLAIDDIDGGLIGGASLSAKKFKSILLSAQKRSD